MSEDDDTLFDGDPDHEDDSAEPDCWACYSCGKVEGRRPVGCMCPRCGSIMEEDYL